jgi:predicted ATPase
LANPRPDSVTNQRNRSRKVALANHLVGAPSRDTKALRPVSWRALHASAIQRSHESEQLLVSESYGYYGARRPFSVHGWSVSDFKALEHVELALAPLSVLCGANSSGKSSLIQSLLLVAQTSEDEIILNGPLVRLGLPNDVVRSGEKTVAFSFTLSARTEAATQGYRFNYELTPTPAGLCVASIRVARDGDDVLFADVTRVTEKTQNEVDPNHAYGNRLLRLHEVEGKTAPPRTYISLRGLAPEAILYRQTPKSVLASLRSAYRDAENAAPGSFMLFEAVADWLASDPSRPGAGAGDQRFVPGGASSRQVARLLTEYTSSQLDEIFRHFSESTGTEEWVGIPASRNTYTYRAMYYRSRAVVGASPAMESLQRTLGYAVDGLRNIREQVRYLGPLREEPQVVSPTGARYRNLPTGPKGEYTADLLARERAREVRWTDASRSRKRTSLAVAISAWTAYLGVADSVAVEDQGKLGRGLRVKIDGADRDLTMVGVGASQVLPVLAVVLSAPEQSVVLLEQPELHLHPAVQSKLADFLLFARPDIRLVVETHSEYLITRVRRRVAEGARTSAQVNVMFAERDASGSNFRKLILDQFGDFDQWPSGFFDMQDEDGRAIVRAVRSSLKNNHDTPSD